MAVLCEVLTMGLPMGQLDLDSVSIMVTQSIFLGRFLIPSKLEKNVRNSIILVSETLIHSTRDNEFRIFCFFIPSTFAL